MKEIICNYTSYNLWANTKLGNYLKKFDLSLLDKHITSSYPSIRQTLLHNWSVEVGWLARLKKTTEFEYPSEVFKDDTYQLISGLVNQSDQFDRYVQGLSIEELEESKDFKFNNKKDYTFTAVEMIHHCMNHSSYHRGQIVTMARQLGMENIPATDQIEFFNEN